LPGTRGLVDCLALGLLFAAQRFDIGGELGTDLAEFNGEPSLTLPMPARYVIAPDGVIAYAEVNPDYTRRPNPSELMPTLKRLGHATAA
jgi:peroxiredoxin